MPVPRDAATVILADPRPDGTYAVLLTQRPDTMAFMGGTYVFPGGALDDADASDELAQRSALSRDEAAARLAEDIPSERALGLFCAGVREVYEEVGVLLAYDRDGRAVDPAKVRNVYAPHHVEVGHDPGTFAAFLKAEQLTLATDLVVPHGRLITPEQSPIRFDARFFAAPMPEGQAVLANPREVPDYVWITPSEALERANAKDLDIPIPTLAMIQGIAEIPNYEHLMRGTQRAREVEAFELSALITSVVAPNAGLMTGAGTNTYVVGRGDVAIIDPAIPDPVFIERIAREAGNRGHVSIVLLTHTHIDHIGGVAPVAERFGIPVAAFGARDATFVTQKLADDDVIRVGGATLRALHTPGHASDHLCYEMPQERALFTGDVVAGFGTVVISPPDGNLRDYMASLRRLRELDTGRIYPGHGPVVEDPAAKIDEYIEHRLDRERQVVEAMRAGLQTTAAMVERIYAEVPKALHPMAERSVLAHLEMLEADGRASRDGERWALC